MAVGVVEAAIETHGLRRVFKTRKQTVEAVDGVDLTVRTGEIFGFLGPNGAGKTTTLRMLATLLPPSGGKATVAGCDLLILLAVPFGLSINIVGVVVVLALIALIGLLTASVAYAVALWTRSENSYAPIIFTSTLPILLLSSVLLPLGLAPSWLRNIALANPLSYAVDAARAVFLGHLGDPSVVKGVVVMAVLCLISIVLGARAFGRAVA